MDFTISLFTIFILFFVYYIEGEISDQNLNFLEEPYNAPVFQEIIAFDDIDRYGRVRIVDYPQTDEEYDFYENTGMMCATISFRPYSIFHKDPQFTFFDLSELDGDNHDQVGYLVTANHIGKRTELDRLSAMTAFSINHGNSHNQICVRDYANYGESVIDTFFGGINQAFDVSNAVVDWMYLARGRFGAKILITSFEIYGCTEIDTPFNTSEYTLLLTLQHTEFQNKHEGAGFQFHYDSVWTEVLGNYKVKVCWTDVDEWNAAHNMVLVQLIGIPKTSISHDLTLNPTPIEDYIADSYTFPWPDDDSVQAVCVDIPFSKTFSFIPYMFVSLSLDVDDDESDTFLDKSTTSWVEEASASAMRVCISELYWTDRQKMANSSVTVNYLVVENLRAAESLQATTQDAQSKLIVKGLNESKTTDTSESGDRIASQSFITDTKTWIESYIGTFQDNLKVFIQPEKDPNNGLFFMYVYFFLLRQDDPESILKILKEHLDSNTKAITSKVDVAYQDTPVYQTQYFYTPEQSEIDYFNQYTTSQEKLEIPPLQAGGQCVLGRNQATKCQPSQNLLSGYQCITREPLKEAFGVAEACLNGGLTESFPCNTSYSKTSFGTTLIYLVAGSDYEMYYERDVPSSVEPTDVRTGISIWLFVGVIIFFVVLMIVEYFAVNFYVRKQYNASNFIKISNRQLEKH